MGYVRAIEVDGNIVPASAIKNKSSESKRRFNIAEESLPSAVARNIYKPVRETVSTLGGMPGDMWNALAGLVNYAQEKADPYLSIGDQPSGGLPALPDILTSSGIREDIMKPLGESIFGSGSQEEQPGFLEGLIEKGSKWAPYTIGGAGIGLAKGASGLSALSGLGGGLGTNVLQGLTGQTIEELGGGSGAQFAGEALTGLGAPIAAKLLGGATKRTTKRIAEKLTSKESKAWDLVDKAATKAGAVDASAFEGALIKAEKDLTTNIVATNRKATQSIIEEAYNSISKNKIDSSTLVGTRKKINNAIASARDTGTRSILKNIKNSVDEQLGKSIGNLNLDAASATIIKKEFTSSRAYRELIKSTGSKFGKEKATDLGKVLQKIAPYGAAIGSYIFKSPVILASAIGVPVASRIIKNASRILSNPLLRKEALKSLRNIGVKSAISTTAEYKKRGIKKKEPVGYIRYNG